MTERFTERVGDGIRYYNGEYIITCYPKNNNLTPVDKLAAKLCDFEDQIENGTIIALPFRVGGVIYDIYDAVSNGGSDILEFKISEIHIKIDRRNKPWIIISDYYFAFEDFGKTVFLTKEEAEKALAERG